MIWANQISSTYSIIK